ncbi:hypothetical protein NST21_17590 [Peribacillus sp. FSL K6-1552]|uniref:hypothetical protein n=1 Tax=Peribacillus sp. FSL K6-1552 TaxID=2954514 RepID=UPI0030FAAE60
MHLPEGQNLTSYTTYTVICDWAKIKNPSFIAEAIASPPLKSAEAIDNKLFQITFDKNLGMELFPGRKVELKGDDGRNIEAQYRFSPCKGPYGIFDVLNDNTFKSGVKYSVVTMGNWANPDTVTLTAK